MKTSPLLICGILAAVLLAFAPITRGQGTVANGTATAAPSAAASAPGAGDSGLSDSVKAPVLSVNTTVFIELTEAGAGTPTVIAISHGLLGNVGPAAAKTAAANAGAGAMPTVIAGLALSLGMMFGGLHYFRPKRRLLAPAVLLVAAGLATLTAGALRGDIAPPGIRHPPMVAGHAVLKVTEDGQGVHIVVPRELLTALLAQPPVKP